MTQSYKMTFAALAAITAALSLAVTPTLINQVFAQDCPGCQGQGHNKESTNRGGQEKDADSPAAKCQIVYAGQSDNVKFQSGDKCKQR